MSQSKSRDAAVMARGVAELAAAKRLGVSALALLAGTFGVSGLAHADKAANEIDAGNAGAAFDQSRSWNESVTLAASRAAVAPQPAAATPQASTNPSYKIDTGSPPTINIAAGAQAILIPDGQQWAAKAGEIILYADNNNLFGVGTSSPFGGSGAGSVITSGKGSTLTVLGNQTLGWGPWWAMSNMLNLQGNLVIQGDTGNNFNLVGTNTILGDLTLLTGATLNAGENWGATSQLIFGATTDVSLATNTTWYWNEGSGNTSTIGGMIAAVDPTAKIELASGTLVLNGQNTDAAPFLGTFTLDPGATLMIGDAAHATAIFGDPNNTNGSTQTLNVTRSPTGTAAVLEGYGTIYASVLNPSGVVIPGGGNTPGTLTVSNYTQGATGTLVINLTPQGASQLKSLGPVTLGGTLDLAIAAGQYGTAIYPVISGSSITGSFASTITTGNAGGAIAGMVSTATGLSIVTEAAGDPGDGAPIYGHLVSANRSAVSDFNRDVFDVIETNDAVSGASRASYGNGLAAWVEPIGRLAHVSHDGVSYDTSSGGVEFGFDKHANEGVVLGVAAGWAKESLDTVDDLANADTSRYNLAVYGGINLQYARLDADIFYNHYDSDVTRTLGTAGSALASVQGNLFGGSAQISQGIYNNLLVPYIRGSYFNGRQSSATESGSAGPLALTIGQINGGYVIGDAGLRIHPAALFGNGNLRPEIDLAVEHDFSTRDEQVTGGFATLSSTPFTWSWKGNQDTSALAGVSLNANLTPQIEVFGKLEGRFTSYEQAGEISAGARYLF